MSTLAIIIYEVIYIIIYFSLLFSKGTFLRYYPDPSFTVRIVFLLILFSGFFIPYLIKVLRINFSRKHYLAGFFVLVFLYCFSSSFYYSKTLHYNDFHSYIKTMPLEQHVEVPKPADVFRIICFGGSTTFDGGYPIKLYDGGYPEKLHKMLREKYPHRKIQVLNAGMIGYSTQDAIIQYLFHLKALQPDVVIFFEALNDIMPSFTQPPFSSAPFRNDYGHFYGLIGNIRYPKTFETFLSGFFYADLLKPELTPACFSDFKSLECFRRNLETIIEITRCAGIKLILSNQAHCFEYTDKILWPDLQLNLRIDKTHYADTKSWYTGMELFNKTSRETADKYSVTFVDQATVFKDKKELFKPEDCVHMTHTGLEIKARLFYDKIIELGLLR